MRTAFTGTIFHMNAAELDRLAQELGLDVVGAAPASAYTGTERHIRERKARGLFADMRFTMAQPEVSCHPEKLVPGAATVASAASTACSWMRTSMSTARRPCVRASASTARTRC